MSFELSQAKRKKIRSKQTATSTTLCGKYVESLNKLPCASHCPRRSEDGDEKSLSGRSLKASKTDKPANLLHQCDKYCVWAMPGCHRHGGQIT